MSFIKSLVKLPQLVTSDDFGFFTFVISQEEELSFAEEIKSFIESEGLDYSLEDFPRFLDMRLSPHQLDDPLVSSKIDTIKEGSSLYHDVQPEEVLLKLGYHRETYREKHSFDVFGLYAFAPSGKSVLLAECLYGQDLLTPSSKVVQKYLDSERYPSESEQRWVDSHYH